LGERFKDPEFRSSLDLAMSEGIKRVSRLTNQCATSLATPC